MFPPQLHEIVVVSFLRKKVLSIISTVEDVIESPKYKRSRVGGHRYDYKT
jgi:hypothetical protein